MQATQRILKLTDSFDTRRNRVMSVVGQGDPARQAAVQQEATNADLIVVGKRQHVRWLDLLFESTSQRLLRWASSDILVVPHGYSTSARTAALKSTVSQPQEQAGQDAVAWVGCEQGFDDDFFSRMIHFGHKVVDLLLRNAHGFHVKGRAVDDGAGGACSLDGHVEHGVQIGRHKLWWLARLSGALVA